MWDLTWRNLRFRKLRTFLTVLAIAAPAMLSVILGGITDFMKVNMQEDLARQAGQVMVRPPLTGKPGVDLASSVLGMEAAEAERVLAAVQGYDPARTSPVVYKELEPSNYPNGPAAVLMMGVLPGRERAVLNGVKLADGAAALAPTGEAIIGPRLMERHGVGVGDPITVAGHTFRVKGIIGSKAGSLEGMLLLSLADAQAMAGMRETVSAVSVGFADLALVEPAKAALAAAFPEYQLVTHDDLIANAEAMLKDQEKFFGMTTYNGMATAAIVVFLVMYMVVMERTREIGTLRAVGAPRWQVVALLLQEAGLMGVLGGILGSAGSVPLLKWTMGSDDTTFMEAYLYNLPSMGWAMVITVGVAVLATAYPAWRAARINPIEALRYE